MSLLGQTGLQRVAKINYAKAHAAKDQLVAAGFEVITPRFFNEFTVKLAKPAIAVVEALAVKNVLGGVPFARLQNAPGFETHLIIAVTETVSDTDIATLVATLKEVAQ
jgi:glycine dehydrogenase subunit 1